MAHATVSQLLIGRGRGLFAPVFDSKARYARHVFDVRRHERGAECQCMRGNRGVEILDVRPPPFERGFDATVGVTRGVGPLDALKLRTDQVKPLLQSPPALGTR